MGRNILMHYDYDDILIGSNNLDQQLVWFKKHCELPPTKVGGF